MRKLRIYLDTSVINFLFAESKRDDAMHVAICTVLGFDVLLSWNFQHLANVKKQIGVNTVNQRQGYLKPLLLVTPLEVMDDESESE